RDTRQDVPQVPEPVADVPADQSRKRTAYNDRAEDDRDPPQRVPADRDGGLLAARRHRRVAHEARFPLCLGPSRADLAPKRFAPDPPAPADLDARSNRP